MKLFTIGIVVLLMTVASFVNAQELQSVPYTLEDRDRVIRIEVKMEALEEKFDARIDYIFWLQGVIVALILFTLGYTIWDRRTALKPALDKALEAENKTSHVLGALREYSKKHPDLADILKTHGLL